MSCPADSASGSRSRARSSTPGHRLGRRADGRSRQRERDEIVALMRRLNQEHGLTFLIVTHDIGVGRKTDRIVRMVDGQIVNEEVLGEVSMVARATMAEIDPVRMSIDDAVELFRESVVPALHDQEGYEGVYVLLSNEGKALVLTFWSTGGGR